MINHVFSRDFYSRMLFTCRILIGSIVGVTFWWASVNSYWSCWKILWHKPVLIIHSRSYFCRQNILLALHFEKKDLRTYRLEYWSYLSLPIYWSTGVFFASKYFSKTGQLCEKFNPVACFTHALPDHRQQHPDEFCHIFTEIDEIMIMIEINKWMIIWI